MRYLLTTAVAATLVAGVFATALAQQAEFAEPYARPYDGIQAGYDAYRLAEERRRANLDQQLFVNDQNRYWAGLPTTRGETIFYGGYGAPAYGGVEFYGGATPFLPPASLEATYAYGRRGPFGGYRGWSTATVFEPWPFVPGDLYGYRYYSPVRQPIGQHQEQTGPNRWESHPVYDPPLPHYRALPPVDSPWLDGTPYETPRPAVEVWERELPAVTTPESTLPPSASELPADASELPAEPPPTPRRTPREY